MLTYREAEQASKNRGVAIRRKGWPKGMYHRHHESGKLTAGFDGDTEDEEITIRDDEGVYSLDLDAAALNMDRDDMVAYVQGKDDWEIVKTEAKADEE